MMRSRLLVVLLVAVWVVFASGCTRQNAATVSLLPVELRHFPLDSTQDLISLTDATVDTQISSDGQGSVRIDVKEPKSIPLFEVSSPNVDNATLLYQAKLKTQDFDGKVYLEMWCHFDGKGEYFSRALQGPLSGTMNWTSQETPFFLKPGEKPDRIKLNVVADGKGTLWVDDIHLKKGALQ